MLKKICTIIPTYNNAQTIERLIACTLKYSDTLIVVNDGSTDETAAILLKFNKQIHLVSYEKNQGKGFALKKGFEKAKKLNFDYAITLDADLQHHPDKIPLLLKALETQEDDVLILGIRTLQNENMSKGSTFANKFSNFWVRLQTGKNIGDTQCGFRIYPLAQINPQRILTKKYETELELLVRLAWSNTKIISVPISVHYPNKEDRVSHFRPVADFFRISILNTVFCIAALFYGYPKMLLFKLFQK